MRNHAIDRASQRLLEHWQASAAPGEGLYSWLKRVAREALDEGEPLPERKDKPGRVFVHRGIWFVFNKSTKHPRLVTVFVREPAAATTAPVPAAPDPSMGTVPTSVPPGSPEPETPPPATLGQRFLDGLVAGLREGRLEYNSAKARVHVVPGGVLLTSPRIFQDYAAAGAEFQAVQRSFQKLRLHRVTTAGLNIHSYAVAGSSAVIKGFVLPDPGRLFGEIVPLPNPRVVVTCGKWARCPFGRGALRQFSFAPVWTEACADENFARVIVVISPEVYFGSLGAILLTGIAAVCWSYRRLVPRSRGKDRKEALTDR